MSSPYCQILKETSMYDKWCKLKSFCNTVQYMYGVFIHHNTKEALKPDEENGIDNWKKAIRLDIQQLMDYTIHFSSKA